MSSWRGAAAGVVTASSMIALAACAGANQVPAPVAPPPNSTPTLGSIPPVDNPRDLTTMSQRPCELLTPQQAIEFRLDLPADQLTGLHGTLRCKWTTTTGPAREIVRMLDVNLSVNSPAFEVAYTRDRGLPVFEVTTIAGYPALVTMTNVNLPICTVKVKVAEQQSLSVDYEDKAFNKTPRQSCALGKRVAGAVLTNVPAKS